MADSVNRASFRIPTKSLSVTLAGRCRRCFHGGQRLLHFHPRVDDRVGEVDEQVDQHVAADRLEHDRDLEGADDPDQGAELLPGSGAVWKTGSAALGSIWLPYRPMQQKA